MLHPYNYISYSCTFDSFISSEIVVDNMQKSNWSLKYDYSRVSFQVDSFCIPYYLSHSLGPENVWIVASIDSELINSKTLHLNSEKIFCS